MDTELHPVAYRSNADDFLLNVGSALNLLMCTKLYPQFAHKNKIESSDFMKSCVLCSNKAHISWSRHMPHLGKVDPKEGTAGQAFRHEEKGALEVAI